MIKKIKPMYTITQEKFLKFIYFIKADTDTYTHTHTFNTLPFKQRGDVESSTEYQSNRSE